MTAPVPPTPSASDAERRTPTMAETFRGRVVVTGPTQGPTNVYHINVYSANSGGLALRTSDTALNTAMDKAKAAALAINAHDALVAALRELVARCEYRPVNVHTGPMAPMLSTQGAAERNALAAAHAALALATTPAGER